MQVGISDVALWEGIVLLNFRILNTCPYDIVIKYGAYCQKRTNQLEDSRRQKSKDHPEKESRRPRKHGFAVYKNHGQFQKTQGENQKFLA